MNNHHSPRHPEQSEVLLCLPLLLLLLLLLLTPTPAKAQNQLPPGTTDTTLSPQPAPEDPLRTQAAEALDKQDFPTAYKLLNQLVAKYPADATLLYNLGYVEDARANNTDATTDYRKSIAANPTYFEPHLALGLLLARTNKLAEARTELTTAITLDTPDNALKARAYRALARLDQTTDPAAASNDLLEAIKLSSETVEDALLAGELAEAAHDPAAAEATYRRILATHPSSPEVTAALAHLLLTSQRASEAETLLNVALAAHVEDLTLTSQLAATYAAQNRSDQAVPLMEKLHAATPDDANLTLLLAHLYVGNKQPEKAEPLYAALLAQSPHNAPLLAEQGENQLALQHYTAAQTTLTKAIADPKAFPNKTDLGAAAGNLAFAASQNRNPALVLQALALRASVLPPSPASYFLAATAHDTLHHRKQAADLYKQFLATAQGKFPDEESEAKRRLQTLSHP